MKITLVLAASILSLASFAAQATTPAGAGSVEIKYSDLDLNRKAGVATLYQRIQGAAKQVCAAHDGRRITEQRAHAACLDNAVLTAVARINRPMLSEYVAAQMGKTVVGAPARVAVR
jgi:UrcA family protein